MGVLLARYAEQATTWDSWEVTLLAAVFIVVFGLIVACVGRE